MATSTELRAAVREFVRPISTHDPVGPYLLLDPLYDRIREARRADDPSLPRDIWDRTLKSAEWEVVEELCTDALLHTTKDLQIAAWLTEAWTRSGGFEGLAHGLEVIDALCEAFWDDIHPRPREGEWEFRAAPFDWINEKLPLAVQEVPVVGHDAAGAVASWEDWQRAKWHEQLRRRVSESEQEEEEGKQARSGASQEMTLARFSALRQATPPKEWAARAAALGEAVRLTKRLESRLDEWPQDDGPTLIRLLETCREIEGWVGVQAAHAMPGEVEEDSPSAHEAPEHKKEAAVATSDGLPHLPLSAEETLRGREDAYRRLLEIADYLQQLEPHSPTPYLIRRAVSWGQKTLGELLQEFTADGLDIPSLFSLLGLDERAPPDHEDDYG